MKSRNVLIFILVLTILLMGGSYAFIAKDLEQASEEKMKGTNWDIKISEVSEVSTSGNGVAVEASSTGTNVTVRADLKEEFDEVVYRFTIRNEGNVDALVNSLTGIKEVNDKRADVYLFLEGVNAGDIIAAGEEKVVSVNIGLNEGGKAFNEVINLGVNLVQA